MAKDLMKTNCYDVEETMIIVGSCLENMNKSAYNELQNMSNNIYEVCLESTHLNMVITKLVGMICRKDIKKIIFATVDKSPHCVQLHYIESEIRKAMDTSNIDMQHFVAVKEGLVEISKDTIKKSKSLYELENELKK